MLANTPTVVLLHGWPGTTSDFSRVLPLLDHEVHAIVPNLLGFGDGYVGEVNATDATAIAHADRILRLIRERGVHRPIVAGYDVGSRVAQAVARLAPDEIGGLVITPGYPGIGDRMLGPHPQSLLWYHHFHKLELAPQLLDGNETAIRTYLGHFWRSWSARDDLTTTPEFDAVVAAYSRPGAFAASIQWYRAEQRYEEAEAVSTDTIMMWPDADPLVPVEWSDRLGAHFRSVELRILPRCGHFVPVEAPARFAEAIADMLRRV